MSESADDGAEFLKCDAPQCDHFEVTPITIDVVDKPCPKCGANLCTAGDFVLFNAAKAATDAANAVAIKADPSAQFKLVAVNVHDGEILREENPVIGQNPFPNKSVQP